MSTEQTPKHKPPVEIQPKAPKREETDLEVSLKNAWKSAKSGSSSIYVFVVAVVLVVAAYFGWQWYSATEAETSSALWVRLTTTGDADALKELTDDETIGDTLPAKVAGMERARYLLGPMGIERLGTRDENQRKDAVENVKTARDLYRELADKLKDQPVLRMEALFGAAQAEETLVGIPKEEGSAEWLGSIDQAIADLREIGKIAADMSKNEYDQTLAKKAEEKARQLEENREDVEQFYVRLYEFVKGQQFSTPTFQPPTP